MRIAIITFHRAYNCGAMLQAWALKTVLERMGHKVEFPVLNHVGETKRWKLSWIKWSWNPVKLLRSVVYRVVYNIASIPGEDLLRHRFKLFRQKYLVERVCRIDELDKLYDVIIVGSDQVWNEDCSKGEAPLFLAEGLPSGVKKIAYAVSCGDKALSDERLITIGNAVRRFVDVSVRENIIGEQLRRIINKELPMVLDPTLLLDVSDYNIWDRQLVSEPCLFMYTLSTNDFFINTARLIAKKLAVKLVIAPMYQFSRYKAPRNLTYGISPDRLVSYVARAKYVLSGSFHGTVLSILFNKPFLSLRLNAENQSCPSRVGTLLALTKTMQRLVTPDVAIDEMVTRLTAPVEIDFAALKKEREISLKWLEDNLS